MNDVCTGCGEPNPPGTQFCLFCGIYLGWDDGPDERESPRLVGEAAAVRDEGDITAPLSDPTAPLPATPALGAGGRQGSAQEASAPDPRGEGRLPAVAPGSPLAPTSGGACPSCGRPNGAERRFCGHCGQVLATGAPARRPEPRRRSWWHRVLRSDTRQARQAYRRSLPLLYRWRRVGVTALVALVVFGGLAAVGRDPVGWTIDRWYDVTNRLDPIRDVSAQAVPEESVVRDNHPNGLLDADPLTAWVTGWTPPQARPACGESRGGRVVLTFPATRVRELRVATGITDASERPLQHIPTQLDVQLPDGSCQVVQLTRAPDVQEVPFDTGGPVGRLTISIGEAHSGDDERVQDVAGLSQLTLLARPSR